MREEQTWAQMFEYLKKQKNCSLHDKEFTVPDLQLTLSLYDKMIKRYSPEEAQKSKNCYLLKCSLKRMFDIHKQNKFKEII